MKKITIIASLLMLIACKPANEVENTSVTVVDSGREKLDVGYSASNGARIKLKESVRVDGDWVSIIEVDSVEYIMPSKGGIIRIYK